MKKSTMWVAGVGILAVVAVSVATVAMRGNQLGKIASPSIVPPADASPYQDVTAFYSQLNLAIQFNMPCDQYPKLIVLPYTGEGDGSNEYYRINCPFQLSYSYYRAGVRTTIATIEPELVLFSVRSWLDLHLF